MTLIGFVLLLYSSTPSPVSEAIYPSQQTCEQMKHRLAERQPDVQFVCAEVYR